jgi:hypothetical protein
MVTGALPIPLCQGGTVNGYFANVLSPKPRSAGTGSRSGEKSLARGGLRSLHESPTRLPERPKLTRWQPS